MKISSLAILFFFLHSVCCADVLYLKDGSKVRGEVASMDESEVKVILSYGTLTVKRTDVLRIDLAEGGEPMLKPPLPEEKSEEEPEEIQELQPEGEPELGLELATDMTQPKKRKSPNRAAMLAVVPGAGYAYLGRWDLALAAAGIELGLGALAISLASDEGEGSSSTGYVIFGFLGLLKVAEVFDSHGRAVEWNRRLDEEAGKADVPLDLIPPVGTQH
jgi:hypothetical protein